MRSRRRCVRHGGSLAQCFQLLLDALALALKRPTVVRDLLLRQPPLEILVEALRERNVDLRLLFRAPNGIAVFSNPRSCARPLPSGAEAARTSGLCEAGASYHSENRPRHRHGPVIT